MKHRNNAAALDIPCMQRDDTINYAYIYYSFPSPFARHFFFWKTFNRLRHRDKLTTVMLGWLGSATYSRWLVKIFLFLLFLFPKTWHYYLIHYVFPSLDSWRRACSWTLGATIYVRMRRIGPSEHVPLRTVRGEKKEELGVL